MAKFIEVDGLRARYEERGAGPPLVLLASTFLLARTYRGLARRLAAHFRVLTVEPPGSGGSEDLAEAWGYTPAADWAARLIGALGLDRATVLGHSDSGGVALVLAARHPERVAALVLADASGAVPGGRSWPGIALGRLADALPEWRLNFTAGPHILSNLARHPRNFLYRARKAVEGDLLAFAPAVAAPTLVAWGRADHTYPPDCAARLGGLIPEADVYLSSGSHDWLILRPDEFAAAVVAFARRRGLLPASAQATGSVA